MTTKNVYVCDGCGKTTMDYYADVGWLVFEKGIKVLITKGRDGKRQAVTYQRDANPATSNESAHFCSVECLLKWIYGSNLIDMDIHLGLEGLYE